MVRIPFTSDRSRMTRNYRTPARCWAWLGIGIFVAFSGCNSEPPPVEVPKWDPPLQAARGIELYDKNSDGKIDSSEMSPGLKAALDGIDTDNDGSISEPELTARIQAFADTELGLIGVQGLVSYGGRKVPDAKVTFEPESFLADAISPATGTVGADGYYSMQTEGQDIDAVQPGIYTVRITKPDASGGETLPARFNSKSELGTEVGREESAQDRGASMYDWRL